MEKTCKAFSKAAVHKFIAHLSKASRLQQLRKLINSLLLSWIVIQLLWSNCGVLNMVRMDSADAHLWLKDNLFQGCRVDARKKNEYKAKFKGCERADWKSIQVEWMKYCLMLKYRCNALYRKDLYSCGGKLPVEDATNTNYVSNLFWGAALVEVDGKKYYFGCNVLGKLHAELRKNDGKLTYELPAEMHLFGKPILTL